LGGAADRPQYPSPCSPRWRFISCLRACNAGQWIADNLKNTIVINVVLAVFNMLPIPRWTATGRVDCCEVLAFRSGGTVWHAYPDWNFDHPPLVGNQIGLNLDIISRSCGHRPAMSRLVLFVTGMCNRTPTSRRKGLRPFDQAADM